MKAILVAAKAQISPKNGADYSNVTLLSPAVKKRNGEFGFDVHSVDCTAAQANDYSSKLMSVCDVDVAPGGSPKFPRFQLVGLKVLAPIKELLGLFQNFSAI